MMHLEERNLLGTGCTPSKMDGTEYVYSVDDKIALPEEFSYRDVMPPVRNQGSSYTCVCQSLTGLLDFIRNSRNNTPNVCNNFSIEELYDIRSNKPGDGMSFKEAFHYLRHHGLDGEKINTYSKLVDVDSAKNAIVMFGPIVAGFPTYSGSLRKFWIKRGFYQGGHAVMIVGYTKDGFIIRNSWGEQWADNGHVIIPFDEFDDYCFEAWTAML